VKKALCLVAVFSVAVLGGNYLATCALSRPAQDIRINQVLAPVVRVHIGDLGGGSGVIIRTDRVSGRTLILTAGHVVRHLEPGEIAENELLTVDLFIYGPGGHGLVIRTVPGTVIQKDYDQDMAIIEIHDVAPVVVAPLLPETEPLRLFDAVYAVGCPTMLMPISTLGEIVSFHEKIGDTLFLTATANTIFGNSGGALMVQRHGRWYLCGLMVKGRVAHNQFLTHIGFYIPLDRIRPFVAQVK